MKKLSRRLRTQISMSMIAVAFATLMVFVVGMAVFYTQLQESWVEGLSEANRQTLETLIANGEVQPDELTTLINAFSISWSSGYADQEFLAVVLFSFVALLFAAIFGILIARRLSRPIEAVTEAARQVTMGNLNEGVGAHLSSAVETRNLVTSFNQMVRSLEQAERESAASAAAIAHELRTPLTILRGRLQGIADGTFEPADDVVLGLVSQVDTLSRIIDDLAVLSRLSSGRFELELRETDLAEEVSTALKSLRPELQQFGFAIEEDLQSVPLMADGARIRQALNALVANVLQYADQGRFVRIETRLEDGAGVLSVTDNGPGIAIQDRERVFDRWWRGEKSRVRSKGGSGLGLSIVRSIAKAHGGQVWVTEDGKANGARFMMIFPLELVNADQDAP